MGATYRIETFCYGPRSCALYQAGPARKVPGRRRAMTYTEEDWVDDEATSHRRLEKQNSQGTIARCSGPDPTGRKSLCNACPWPPTE